MNETDINKLNKYDFVLINTNSTKYHTYIYDVDTKLKIYKIFNKNSNQFENISWSESVSLIDLPKRYYYAQPVEYIGANKQKKK